MLPRVLLTHSYFYRFDEKQWRARQPYPPLGTLYAASILLKEGAPLSFYDSCLSPGIDAYLSFIRSTDHDLLIIYDDGFNYLTKMCLTNMREAAFRMILAARSANKTVVVCSSDSTDHYEEYIEKGADYVILGEGEETLKELYGKIREGAGDMAGVKGLAWRNKEGEIVKNDARPVIRDLDALPLPAWHRVDIESYRNIWQKTHGYFSLNISTTRGCPYQCNWCAKPIYGYEYNSRSPENVVEEVEFLVNELGADHLWICDDIFGLKKGWIRTFRELMEERELRISYTLQSRADLVTRDGIAADMAASGASMVWLGAESGSQKILDAMNKAQTVDQIKEARWKLKESNIDTGLFLQFGYPGEDQEDIKKTIDMLLELMPEDVGISISYPLPGTKFYAQVKEDLKEKSNWTDSDDLALMYKGTYPVDYYRKLHRYTHRRFRKKQRIREVIQTITGKRKPDRGFFRKLGAIVYYIPAIWWDRLSLKRLVG